MFLKLKKGSRCALVYGQMNEPPGARARVGLTGLTVAEYFRDEEVIYLIIWNYLNKWIFLKIK